MEEKVKRFRFERLRWEYVLTTPIFAVAIYIYFCARNMKELSVPFILASAAILFLFALAAYFAVYLIVRRGFTAMLFCLFCWVGCYAAPLTGQLSDKIQTVVAKVFGLGLEQGGWPVELLCNTLIVLAVAILLTIPLHKIRNKEIFTKLVGGVSLVLLGMNALSIIFSIFLGMQDDDGFELKNEFVQEDGLASPNIYWIHPDGMLGFDAFEKYFGDPQDALTAALTDRGFDIARSAGFESAHNTSIAVPMLTSPYAYDTWISQYTVSHDEAMKMTSSGVWTKMSLLRQNAELQKAFYGRGYTVNVIGKIGYHYPLEGGYTWPAEFAMEGVWRYGKKTDGILAIQRMLTNTAEINFFFWLASHGAIATMKRTSANYDSMSEYRVYMPDEEARAVILDAYQNVEREVWQAVPGLYDLLNGGYNSPRLTMIHNLIAHYPFRFNEDGSTHEETDNPLDYYTQHIYSGKVLVGMVDMIIESDPDAVIVIQADHGLHLNTEEDFLQAFGEDANAVELWNSVISAVRVPKQYQNGEEHYMMDTPLNIARYLVNNFVGRNYEYLVSE